MSILETTLIFGGIPLLVYVIIAFLSFLGKADAGTHPKHYDLGQPWTHEPVLWSATGETIGHGRHDAHAIESGADLIGGAANGRW